MRRAELEIGRLILRGPLRDEPALRVSCARLVAPLAAPPPGLSPRATLVIRRMVQRAPKGWRAGGAPSGEWARASRETLGDWARRAARPARGPVPADAGAVLFLDEADLFACWLRDLARGVGEAWYWRSLFGAGAQRISHALDRLIEHAEVVPQVIAALAALGACETVVQAVQPAQAGRVWRAMLSAHRIEMMATRAVELAPGWAADELPREIAATRAPPLPPWSPWVVTPCAWAPERAALVGWARVLAVAPHLAASARFMARHHAWHASTVDARADATPRAADGDGPNADSGVVPPWSPDRPRRAATADMREGEAWAAAPAPAAPPEGAGAPRSPDRDERAEVRALRSRGPDGADTSADPAAPHTAPPEGARATIAEAHDVWTAAPTAVDADAIDDDDPVTALAPTGRRDLPTRAREPVADVAAMSPWSEDGVVTALGGVFHLLPVMARLGSLETADLLHARLGAWALFEALACAAAGEPRPSDALWAVLAALTGRAPNAPLELPADLTARALAIWAEAELARAAALYRPQLGELTWREVVLRPAHVYLTRTHVDVVQRIEQVSLVLRVAGLDRDPGWLPAFGRVVTFHYL